MPSSFFARAISARFLLFCAVSARCVPQLCSTALVTVVCGLAQRSQLHCFMCFWCLGAVLYIFVLVRYSYYSSSVAAWAYDSIIYSGVNKRGRDVHCIVGVLGKSSHTL